MVDYYIYSTIDYGIAVRDRENRGQARQEVSLFGRGALVSSSLAL